MTAWRVYLNGNHINTVFYQPNMKADEVKRGLVGHDGFPEEISIRREK